MWEAYLRQQTAKWNLSRTLCTNINHSNNKKIGAPLELISICKWTNHVLCTAHRHLRCPFININLPAKASSRVIFYAATLVCARQKLFEKLLGQTLPSLKILHLAVPALLHQPAVRERPHDAQCENHDDDEWQEELGDGEKEHLWQTAARVLESGWQEGVGDHDGKEPHGDAYTLGHAGVPPPTGRFHLREEARTAARWEKEMKDSSRLDACIERRSSVEQL